MDQAESSQRNPLLRPLLLIQVTYVAALLAASFYFGGELRAPLILTAASLALVGRMKLRFASVPALVLDFVPFVVLIAGYEAMRGLAYSPTRHVHFESLVSAESYLFSVNPTAYLQKVVIGTAFEAAAFDTAKLVYAAHFIVPIVFAGVLWSKSRSSYWLFVVSLVAMSYAGFVCFVLYPAAPPWLACQHGYLELPMQLVNESGGGWFSEMLHISPNPVAAMPSLHAAYSLLIPLFAVRVFGAKAAWSFGFTIVVSFAAVLLAQHYVVDLMAGWLLALLVFAIAASAHRGLEAKK